ncbi:hypothetical protein HK415_04670 [Ramlibacter sp. B156]|uniref:Uncharacterized protein n=1 Tax=Ramlibacter montanisoli TaxID=2732512 RepID=A0A849K4R4_9BURK|nr:hypothetical protein [Ramlibacter montanisoli]NNU42610.1 hypothetical protein [Ramlibacter montanisoli]
MRRSEEFTQHALVVQLIGQPEPHLRVARKERFDDARIRQRVRVLLDPVPHAEEQAAAAREHPACLPEGEGAIRSEHEAEAADDGGKAPILERQLLQVRNLPAEAGSVARARARVIEHGGTEVGGDQLGGTGQSGTQEARHRPGAAREFQHRAGATSGYTGHQLTREGPERDRRQLLVVGTRRIEAHGAGGHRSSGSQEELAPPL